MERNSDKNKSTIVTLFSTTIATLIYVFWSFVQLYAFYLYFKCNKGKGYSVMGFLAACCCSPIYAIYKHINC